MSLGIYLQLMNNLLAMAASWNKCQAPAGIQIQARPQQLQVPMLCQR